MLIDKLPEDRVEKYIEYIQVACSLSKLFSESDKPYLAYRLTENLFCECFGADNVSRTDSSIDAKIGTVGVGIKTFVETGTKKAPFQKIAEFDRDSGSMNNLRDIDLVRRISELRNQRLELTKRIYGVSLLVYHCITRGAGSVRISEFAMENIDESRLKVLSDTQKGTVLFTDGKNRYKFVRSKSTLYTEFDLSEPVIDFGAHIIDDPLSIFDEIAGKIPDMQNAAVRSFVLLPLFSTKKGEKSVPEKSGLNQWNAKGRIRNYDEVYIRVPSSIHKASPGFFPSRDIPFRLILPDGSVLSAKICQTNDKALMSNPNSALGDWILRKVLKVGPGELVTYRLLEELGIDHVSITKNNAEEYSIDFVRCREGEYFLDEPQETIGTRIVQTKLFD